MQEKTEDFCESAEIKTGYEFFAEAIFIAAYDTSKSKSYVKTILEGVAEKREQLPMKRKNR